MASYLKDNDKMTFYEIDPKMRDIAENNFTFLKDSKGKIDVVMGDARISLDKAEPQGYDFLLVDAFTSDSIPVHLITKEAFDIYKKHVKDDGIILFHISNRYISIAEVLDNAAKEEKLRGLAFYTKFEKGANKDLKAKFNLYTDSDYFVVFMPKSKLYKNFENFKRIFKSKDGSAVVECVKLENVGFDRYFTDDYSSLARLFRFWFN